MSSSSGKNESVVRAPKTCACCGIGLFLVKDGIYCRENYCFRMEPHMVPDENDAPRKRRRIEIEEEIKTRLAKVRNMILNIEQMEKDIILLKEVLKEETPEEDNLEGDINLLREVLGEEFPVEEQNTERLERDINLLREVLEEE